MKPTPGVWGLDMGQCALKALRLQEIDGALTATAFDYIEYPKILSQPDAEPDVLRREALQQFLSRNTLRGDIVAIGVPGQSGLARFVKLPPVEEKKIADIVKFEAKQQIPFNLDEVIWDFQKIGSGEVVDGFALETEVGIFAMKRDLIKQYIDQFKDVGVEVHVIQMAPLALCNFLAYDMLGKDVDAPPPTEKQPCAVGLDIGTDSTNLVVTDGVKIIWQRPIPLGGNHFTRALTKDMKLTFAKAEHLKRNATKSGAVELKKILGSLKPVLNDFVGEVQRSLGYFTNTHRDAQIEFMVGLGNAFRLPGMQRFLSEKLQLDVRKIEQMARITGDAVTSSPIYQENILSFGVAYGLCLQAMKRARLVTNLLPPEIRMERLVRAKKPWAVAAAGILLMGLGAAGMGSAMAKKTYGDPRIGTAVTKAGTASGAAKAMQAKFATAKGDATKEEESVKSIVAGQGERVNWMRLLKFIASAVPQPDGKNLPPESVAAYWEQKPNRRNDPKAMPGKDAYQEYTRRIKEGFKPDDGKDTDPLPLGIDDLVQYHIESIDARYCDDLPAFWTAASKDREAGDVRPIHYKGLKPEGKGWVIELSGYTFHADKDSFVRNTLLTNLARLGIKNPMPAAPAGGAMGGGTPTPPAGGAMAGGAPMSGGTPGTPDPNDTKEPVIDRLGFVLLYNSVSKPRADAGAFEIIDKGVLDSLVASSGGAGGGGGPAMSGALPPMGGMMMGMMAGGMGGGAAGAMTGGQEAISRSTWVALSSRGGAGGAMAGGMGGGTRGGGGGGGVVAPPVGLPGGGMRGIGSGPMTGGRGGSMPPEGGTITGGQPATPAPGAGNHVRTEFVILFIWKEPTPSDALRGVEDMVGTATGGTPPSGGR